MNKLQLSLAALATAGTVSLSTMAPASADSAASTRNIILGAAAIAGLAIESNVSRKNAAARNVTGYLSNGSAVYGDGHVVTGNGYSYYPANNGQTVSCNNGNCYLADNTANGNRYGDRNSYGNYASQNNGNGVWRARNSNWRNGNDRNGSDDRDRDHNDNNR